MPSAMLALWLVSQSLARGPIELRSWTPIGPASADGAPVSIGSIAIDPLAGALYAGSALAPAESKVFRKPIGAVEWEEARSPDIGGLFPSVNVTADPLAADVVYAGGGTCMVHPPGCGGRLSRSVDAGASWTPILDQVTLSLAIDLRDDLLLLAVVDSAIPNPMFPTVGTIVGTSVRSNDGGATWADIPVPPAIFGFDPTRPGTIFAATRTEGAWKSMDSGKTWIPINTGLPDLRTQDLSVGSTGVVHLATASGVFVSSDAGDQWEPTGLTAIVMSLAADPSFPGAAYAGNQSGVFRIDERGVATPIGSAISNVWDLAVEAAGSRIWAAATEGVFEYDLRPRPARPVSR